MVICALELTCWGEVRSGDHLRHSYRCPVPTSVRSVSIWAMH